MAVAATVACEAVAAVGVVAASFNRAVPARPPVAAEAAAGGGGSSSSSSSGMSGDTSSASAAPSITSTNGQNVGGGSAGFPEFDFPYQSHTFVIDQFDWRSVFFFLVFFNLVE